MAYKYKKIITENDINTNLDDDNKLPNSKAVRDYVAENSSSIIKLKVVKKYEDDTETYYITDMNNVEVSYDDMVEYMENPNNVTLINQPVEAVDDYYTYMSKSDISSRVSYFYRCNYGVVVYGFDINIFKNSNSYSVAYINQSLLAATRIDTEINEDAMNNRIPSTLAVKNYIDNNSGSNENIEEIYNAIDNINSILENAFGSSSNAGGDENE